MTSEENPKLERWSWDDSSNKRLVELCITNNMHEYKKAKNQACKWTEIAFLVHQHDSRKHYKAPPEGTTVKNHVKKLLGNTLNIFCSDMMY